MKKKIVASLLAMVMVASMAACGSKEEAPAEPEKEEAPAAEEEEAEEETPAEEVEKNVVSGTVTFAVDMTAYEGKKVRVWIPVAQDNDFQTITDVATEAGDVEASINTDALGNKMMYVEWDADSTAEKKASLTFHVAREEVIRPELVEEGTAGAELDEYLTGSDKVVVDGEIKALADEITAGKETYLDKAMAVYDWVYENMVRDNDVVGCGQGDVCALLSTKAGKCTDINSMFVALCRASGVPAREMFGVRINDADITNNEHCWAEWYLPGTGWVGADPADVLKAVLKNEWDKADADALATKDYYWGNTDAQRVELSAGRDLTLEPAQDGAALNDFGYPYAEVDGEVIDFYAPADFVYTISFVQD